MSERDKKTTLPFGAPVPQTIDSDAPTKQERPPMPLIPITRGLTKEEHFCLGLAQARMLAGHPEDAAVVGEREGRLLYQLLRAVERQP